MKKKFLGVLALICAVVGMGTVTSCSDSIQDLKTEIYQDLLSEDSPLYELIKMQTRELERELAQLRSDFEQFKKDVKQCNCDEEAMKDLIKQLQDDLEAAESRLQAAIDQKADAATVNQLVQTVGDLSSKLTTLQTFMTQQQITNQTFQNAITGLQEAISKIKQCSCDNSDIYARLTKVEALADSSLAVAQAASDMAVDNAKMIEDLQKTVGAHTQDIENLKKTVKQNSDDISGLNEKYQDLSGKYNVLNGKYDDLSGKYDDLSGKLTLLDGRITLAINKAAEALAKAQADSLLLAKRIDILEQRSAEVDEWIKKMDGKVEDLDSITQVLNQSVTSMGLSITELQSRTEYLYSRTDSLATACTQALVDAKKYTDQQVAAVLLSIANLDSIAASHDQRLSALESLTGDHSQKLTQLFSQTALLDSIAGAHGENLAYLDSLTNAQGITIGLLLQKTDSIADVCTALGDSINALNDRVDDLEARVATLETQVADLVTKVDNILKVLAGQLNGIIIQGTRNPAFGTLALPSGANTKMLMTYYGEALNDVYFPTQRTGNYVRSEQALTAKDMQMLSLDTDPVFYAGDWMMSSEEYNAGKIYVTINPNTVDCSGVVLQIENSQAVESGVKLSPLVPSKQTLGFGWVRGTNPGNAFYEADAFVSDPTKVQHLNLNTAKIKDAIKEIYKKKLNASLLTVASDLYTVMSQMNLDRNAVKATYTNLDADGNEIESTIYSTYDLAATAVKPLSLESYKDLNYKTIPGYERANRFLDRIGNKLKTSVGNVVKDLAGNKIFKHVADLSLKLKRIEYKGFTPEKLAQLEFVIDKDIVFDSQSCTISFDEPMEVTIENAGTGTLFPVKNASGVTVGYVNMNDLVGNLVGEGADQVSVTIDGLEYHLHANVNADQLKKLLGDVNGEILEAFDDVNDIFDAVKKVCDDVNDLLDLMYDYETRFDNKVDNLLDKVRDYIDRINNRIVNFVNNINQRFQPILLTKTADRIISLSGAKSQPTVVSGSITLIPTTRSFELAVPLCKKHVGVTDVFNGDKSAQAGDADCVSKLKAANSCKNINEVICGDIRNIELGNLAPGYTYEIAYSGLDFHGKIATYKYYITVVE